MEKAVMLVFTFAALIFFAPLIGVLGGTFAGWVLTIFGWQPIIFDFLHRLGVNTDGLALWEVGGAMGFFGGFLKTNTAGVSK